MIVLADEILETFFDHGFADTFELTEKAIEQQKSLGREIFDNLLATGSKFAASTGVSRPVLKEMSISSSDMEATIDAVKETKLDETKELIPEKEESVKEEHVLGDEEESEEEEEEGDLSPDVLEEVDRLLKEYGDEEE